MPTSSSTNLAIISATPSCRPRCILRFGRAGEGRDASSKDSRSLARCANRPRLRSPQLNRGRRTPKPHRHCASISRRARSARRNSGSQARRRHQPIFQPELRCLSRLWLARPAAPPAPDHRPRPLTERLPLSLEFEGHPPTRRTGLQRTPLGARQAARSRPQASAGRDTPGTRTTPPWPTPQRCTRAGRVGDTSISNP